MHSRIVFQSKDANIIQIMVSTTATGGSIIVDTEEKFLLAKEFFAEVEQEVFRHEELYAPVDVFLMKAVLSCEDYASFLGKFNPNITISFVRSKFRIR